MKTAKSKVVPNPNKTSRSVETLKNTKVTGKKSLPSEEEIRKKAEEIYHQRIVRGEQGNATDDWHKAERLLRDA